MMNTSGVPEPVIIVIKLIKIVIESFSVSNERHLRFSDRILSPVSGGEGGRCAALLGRKTKKGPHSLK